MAINSVLPINPGVTMLARIQSSYERPATQRWQAVEPVPGRWRTLRLSITVAIYQYSRCAPVDCLRALPGLPLSLLLRPQGLLVTG